MKMYERYIYDSDQAAVVPTPGAQYDTLNKKVVIDPDTINSDEHLDMRTASILKDFANDVLTGIQIEKDYPNKKMIKRCPYYT